TACCSTLLNPSLRGFNSARNERTKYISQRHGGKTCPERSRRAVPFSNRLTRSRSLETTPPRALTHRQLGRPSIPGHVPPFPNINQNEPGIHVGGKFLLEEIHDDASARRGLDVALTNRSRRIDDH